MISADQTSRALWQRASMRRFSAASRGAFLQPALSCANRLVARLCDERPGCGQGPKMVYLRLAEMTLGTSCEVGFPRLFRVGENGGVRASVVPFPPAPERVAAATGSRRSDDSPCALPPRFSNRLARGYSGRSRSFHGSSIGPSSWRLDRRTLASPIPGMRISSDPRDRRRYQPDVS